jgi:hypothetical protein
VLHTPAFLRYAPARTENAVFPIYAWGRGPETPGLFLCVDIVIWWGIVECMSTQKVNFNCPTPTVKVLDEMAAADHRDRTSLILKALDFYITSHQTTTTNGKKSATKKATR